MKTFKSIITILALAIIFASCEKEIPKTAAPTSDPCSITCQNGGTVTSNCKCDCPPGYSGTNCQTKDPVYSTVTASINSSTYYELCPNWISCDDDYGGALTIDWKVRLYYGSNQTKLIATVYADFKEYSSTGCTEAWIDANQSANQIVLYTAPSGKKITSVSSGTEYGTLIYPGINFHGTNVYTNSETNSFFHKIYLIGDTAGPDLPCDGSTERSRCRVYFKSFKVTLTDK